jgi:hypothetical protein
MLDILVPWVVLLGLIGLAGLPGLKHPFAKARRSVGTGLLGLTGFCGKLAWLFFAALPCRLRFIG